MPTLREKMSSRLSGVLTKLAGQVGVKVTVFRAVAATVGGTTTRTYPVADPALTDVDAFFIPAQTEAAQRPHGVRDDRRARIIFPALDGVLPDLAAFDGVKISTAPFDGWTFLCAAESTPDGFGLSTSVELNDAPAGVIP